MIDPWFVENLVCPIDGSALRWDTAAEVLITSVGRRYPVVDGVPVMLPEGVEPTLAGMKASRDGIVGGAPWYLDSVLLSEQEKEGILRLAAEPAVIDPVVAYLVAATNGRGYAHLVGKVAEYPIPEIRLPPGEGRLLLDVGCSWGRWCVAAGRKGYEPMGMDPSLGAVMAAVRVTRALGVKARFVVGDARFLPFRSAAFDTVFSYSVIQHLSVEDALQSIAHIGRVLKPDGECLVQMPTRYGLRCLMNQAKRGFRQPRAFEVRYWRLKDLGRVFGQAVGKTSLTVDCFFGIGWQPSDAHLMPAHLRGVIAVSESLRAISLHLPLLVQFADSVYAHARKSNQS